MPIKVASSAWTHTDDIDPDKHLDATAIDDAKNAAVAAALGALRNATGRYTAFHCANIQTTLESATATHRGIREVLGWGHNDPASVDALALARLPLEALYNICLFTENADWVDVYVRDGWKKQYVQHLLQELETQSLDRFTHATATARRRLTALGDLVGIKAAQVATIEREHLGKEMPTGLEEEQIPRFPTPGVVLQELPDGDKRTMLERLYFEYIFLCSFVHGLTDANLFKTMFNQQIELNIVKEKDEMGKVFYKEVALRAYTTSLLSIIQAATEVTALYPHDVELKAKVTTAWMEMSQDSLLGKVVWELRTRTMLGILEVDTPPPAAPPHAPRTPDMD